MARVDKAQLLYCQEHEEAVLAVIDARVDCIIKQSITKAKKELLDEIDIEVPDCGIFTESLDECFARCIYDDVNDMEYCMHHRVLLLRQKYLNEGL
jgi:hypothetical protein